MSIFDRIEDRIAKKYRKRYAPTWGQFTALIGQIPAAKKRAILDAVAADDMSTVGAIISTQIQRHISEQAAVKRAQIEADWPDSVKADLEKIF